MPSDIDIGQFLREQMTVAQQALIPTTLRTAYTAATALAATDPILTVASAEDNHGRLVTWATDLAFQRLLTTGRWPFDHRWVPFAKPTGRYLQIRLPASLMSVSQVERPKKPPRRAVFRDNAAMLNTKFLFPEMELEFAITGQPAFILVHGHQDLHFAHIGMSHPTKQRWIYKTPNLMLNPHVIENDAPPVEAEDEEAILTLKDDIRKWTRDNNAG